MLHTSICTHDILMSGTWNHQPVIKFLHRRHYGPKMNITAAVRDLIFSCAWKLFRGFCINFVSLHRHTYSIVVCYLQWHHYEKKVWGVRISTASVISDSFPPSPFFRIYIKTKLYKSEGGIDRWHTHIHTHKEGKKEFWNAKNLPEIWYSIPSLDL